MLQTLIADEGAKKRFGGFFKGKFPMIVCCKERVGNERRLRLAEGSAQGFHCVIVDDLVQTGGTLRNCKNLLKVCMGGRSTHDRTHTGTPPHPGGVYQSRGKQRGCGGLLSL